MYAQASAHMKQLLIEVNIMTIMMTIRVGHQIIKKKSFFILFVDYKLECFNKASMAF